MAAVARRLLRVTVVHLLVARGLALVAAIPAGRVVALGDLHGDLQATERVLKMARIIDDRGGWIGGDTTLVQLGDVLDRGTEERGIWDLLDRLRRVAPSYGGSVVQLLGNHEVLNVLGKAGRYVHREGQEQFGVDRCAAFQPGAYYALQLADCPITAIVGDSAFVHASLPRGATRQSLSVLNEQARRWLRGEGACPRELLGMSDSPIWDRRLSSPSDLDPKAADCAELRETLARLGVARLVVGHTPQDRINAGCDGAVWRCDTGQSRWVMGGACEALEIGADGAVRVLREGMSDEEPSDAATGTTATGEADPLLTDEDALDGPACEPDDPPSPRRPWSRLLQR
jgi:hypothetical protein